MAVLGLGPPYTLEDVKRAYFERAKEAHPDRGGSAANFQRVHEAFQRAQEYVKFRGDRRQWIAGKMESYLALHQAIERVQQFGALVVTDYHDWLEKSFGDFAQLTESPRSVRLVGSPRGSELVDLLLEDLPAWRELEAIELPACRITDQALLRLEYFSLLRRIDVSGTPITAAGTAVAERLPELVSFRLEGTRVGWWRRWRIKRLLESRTP